MIWHIFKKDARLLWWLAIAVAALRFAEVAAAQAMGLFADARLRNLSGLLSLAGILAVGVAICAVIHQDAIPGVRQDWLVRPIRRRDLLLAKVLWVALLIQGPIFVGDTIQGEIAGSGFAASVAAAASRSVFLFLAVDLPFLALASITRNLLEALTACVAAFLGIATFISLMAGSRAQLQPTIGTGVEWLTVSGLILVGVTGAAVLLGLQFFRRRTLLARYLMIVFVGLSILAIMAPWQPVFAIQKSLSPVPGSAAAIVVSFDPTAGRLQGPPSIPKAYLMDLPLQVFFPFRITGLPENYAVRSDRADIRLIEPDGRIDNLLLTSRLSTRQPLASETSVTAYEAVAVPGDVYRRIKDRPVRLDIGYSFTLFKHSDTYALPALNANAIIPGIGWCATKINANGTAIQVPCEQAGRAPTCSVLFLEHVPSGQRNPERFNCDADYSPYLVWGLIPDGMARFGGILLFRDATGLAKYPVDATKLEESRVVMEIYRPVEHFSRGVVIPEITLSQWEPIP